MTKKRNHYIPRVLLRRFAFRETRTGAILWQLRKDGQSVPLETKNAGVESFFYGDPATGVEDQLADIESEWAKLLNWLSAGHDTKERRRDLWRLAWILGIRTRAIREQWTRRGRDMLRFMAGADPETIVSATLREFDRDMENNWEEALSLLPAETRDAARRAVDADPEVKQRLLALVRAELPAAAIPLFQTLLNTAASGLLPGGAARGQIKGLSKLLTAEAENPIDRFAPEAWSVLSFRSQSVVLGDGVSFTIGPGGAIGCVGRFKEDLEAIYVPISHERVLVGHRHGASLMELQAINEASARLSHQVIFASQRSAAEEALARQIGTIEPLLSDAEMTEIVDDAWGNLGRP